MSFDAVGDPLSDLHVAHSEAIEHQHEPSGADVGYEDCVLEQCPQVFADRRLERHQAASASDVGP